LRRAMVAAESPPASLPSSAINASDLPRDFRTIDKLRDWLPIRREQCGKVVFRKSRW
jgi:hypothetical protein